MFDDISMAVRSHSFPPSGGYPVRPPHNQLARVRRTVTRQTQAGRGPAPEDQTARRVLAGN
jgi:hypothetical protein